MGRYGSEVHEIVRHYGDAALLERIIAAVGKAGIDLDDLTVDDLAPVDEFHIGGRAATKSLLQLAGIPPGSRVLDVGSGIGGTARYLAETGSHTVTGVELTPEYVEVARALNELVDLDGSVRLQLADVCNLPFRSASFQAAVMFHVGMNVDDKERAFSEVARVLVDGGVFAIYDIMGPKDAVIDFPVPWAASQSGSFLATAGEYVEALEKSGFEVGHVVDRSDFARQFFGTLRLRTGPPAHLGLHLLMGDEAAVRYGNMVDAVESDTIAPMEIVASLRPAQPPRIGVAEGKQRSRRCDTAPGGSTTPFPCMTDGDTVAGMSQAISVRLDDEALVALRQLEAAGVTRSEAIRAALVDAAARLRDRRVLAAEVAALEADEDDRTEMLAVAEMMERLRAQG